jgi:hypothetical protein
VFLSCEEVDFDVGAKLEVRARRAERCHGEKELRTVRLSIWLATGSGLK